MSFKIDLVGSKFILIKGGCSSISVDMSSALEPEHKQTVIVGSLMSGWYYRPTYCMLSF